MTQEHVFKGIEIIFVLAILQILTVCVETSKLRAKIKPI